MLSEQEDDFDADTRWAIAWFEQSGFDTGDFGDAELLSKAKATSVAGLQQAGLVTSKGGKVRLLRPDELPPDWDPWHRPAPHRLGNDAPSSPHLPPREGGRRGHGGIAAEAWLGRSISPANSPIAYSSPLRRRKLSQEAQGYNALVLGWPEIARLAREIIPAAIGAQGQLI